MGRPQVRLQTESKTERRFITIRDKRNGKTSYQKVYLRTKNEEVARRRLIALDGVDDPEEARRRIDHLASASSEAQERARLADFVHPAVYRQRMTIEDAREERNDMFGGFVDEEQASEELLDRWRRASCIAEWQPILIELGADSEYLLDPHCYSGLHPRGREVDPEWWRKNPDKHHEVLAEQWGMSPEEWLDKGASGEKLLDCIPHFETEKRNKGTSTRHRRTCAKTFKRFVECVGNKPINRLTKHDFISWEDHVRETSGTRSNKWINDQLTPITAIIKIAHRRMRDDLFPEGWRAWIEFGKATYKPGLQNKMPMPVGAFNACLEKAKQWASIDIKACAEAMPLRGANAVMARANNFRQATRIKRAGHMIEAVLRLCCNVGADPVDLERLTWRHLRLRGSLPLFMLPRTKATEQLGLALPRNTPLLPSTVDALKRWKAWRGREAADSKLHSDRHGHEYAEFVFTNDKRRPYKSEKISHAFARLAKTVGKKADDWRLKHLRNVGPALGKRHKRHPDERTTFLAHSESGTNRFYEGDVGEDYLVALVNLIGEEYFDGEQVGSPSPSSTTAPVHPQCHRCSHAPIGSCAIKNAGYHRPGGDAWGSRRPPAIHRNRAASGGPSLPLTLAVSPERTTRHETLSPLRLRNLVLECVFNQPKCRLLLVPGGDLPVGPLELIASLCYVGDIPTDLLAFAAVLRVKPHPHEVSRVDVARDRQQR